MEIPACALASFGSEEEGVEDHAEEVAGEDGADEGLVARRVEWRRFRGEKYQFYHGAHNK
jgi:hypothetical protein